MWLRPDQQKVHKMLSEAITMLCRNGLEFSQDITVEGLLGITLDSKDVFLVNINERVLSGSPDSSRPHTSPQKDRDHGKETADTDTFPFREYEERPNPGKHQFGESILSGPLTPMMQQFNKSPFRRQRGRRKFFNEMRGMRGMRRRFNNPHFRMMHAMMTAHQQPGMEHPMSMFTKGFGMPPFKQPDMPNEPSEPSNSKPATTTVSSEPTSAGEDPMLSKVKVEPATPSLPVDTERSQVVDERFDQEDSFAGFGADSVGGSPWSGHSYDIDGPTKSRAPSSVGTADHLGETFDDIPDMDPSLVTRIKQAIMKEDGCFVTTRMLCRRYSAFFKSHMVVSAMKTITVPLDNPQHIGVFRSLKERSKVFFKCPPNQINPDALKTYNLTLQEYEESYYRMPRPKGMHTPKWDIFVQYVLDSSPYGPMKPTDFTKVMKEKLDPEPVTSMDEFELQHFIVHSEGCFVSSRILCRRLSKQYKVVNVIRAMKAMTRPLDDPSYIGEFIKVSERIKIFFKAPPNRVGSDTYRLYNTSAAQYKQLFYSSPRPWDGSVSNWDSYMENVASRYPFSSEDFPIDSCDVSPDVASRIRNMFAGQSAVMDYTSGLSGFMDMMGNHTVEDMSVSDAQESENTVERIRNIFGPEVVAGLAPSLNILNIDPGEDTDPETSNHSIDK